MSTTSYSGIYRRPSHNQGGLFNREFLNTRVIIVGTVSVLDGSVIIDSLT